MECIRKRGRRTILGTEITVGDGEIIEGITVKNSQGFPEGQMAIEFISTDDGDRDSPPTFVVDLDRIDENEYRSVGIIPTRFETDYYVDIIFRNKSGERYSICDDKDFIKLIFSEIGTNESK